MFGRSARRIGPRVRLTLVATLFGIVGGGCAQVASDLPLIDLTQREALPDAATSEVVPLRMAVAAVLSPEGNIDNYAGLARYLGEYLGQPVELVQRRTYGEVNDLIAAGSVDVAFVCTSAYVAGTSRGEMELLVVPEVNGERVYYSSLIVPTGSNADTFADLEGRVFAFTDPMSFTGRVYPTYALQELGVSPETFFASSFFTYSHDKAIEAVAEGVADGAAVDSLVLDHALARDPGLQDRVKVIHLSSGFGIPPVVVPTGLDVELRFELEQALLGLHNSAVGRSVLAEIGVEKFVLGDDDDYESVRALVDVTGLES